MPHGEQPSIHASPQDTQARVHTQQEIQEIDDLKSRLIDEFKMSNITLRNSVKILSAVEVHSDHIVIEVPVNDTLMMFKPKEGNRTVAFCRREHFTPTDHICIVDLPEGITCEDVARGESDGVGRYTYVFKQS